MWWTTDAAGITLVRRGPLPVHDGNCVGHAAADTLPAIDGQGLSTKRESSIDELTGELPHLWITIEP